jgi:two-component system response regulator VicR
MSKKILVVEDERNIVDILTFNLIREGYETLEALDGAAGLKLALDEDPDLILLDLMLPKMDGFEVCRTLREQGRATPIIMLTAREEETDKVLGLELGADDYITKPFSMRELLARVKSNIRRSEMLSQAAPKSAANRLDFGRLQLDTDTMLVYKDGSPLDLTQREYELVKALASSRGQALSRESLMKQVWNFEGFVGDVRAVDVAIRRLREKIEDDPAEPRFIITRRGLGYAFGTP